MVFKGSSGLSEAQSKCVCGVLLEGVWPTASLVLKLEESTSKDMDGFLNVGIHQPRLLDKLSHLFTSVSFVDSLVTWLENQK